MLDPEIRELPPLRVARLRHVGAADCDLAPVFGQLCGRAGARGPLGPVDEGDLNDASSTPPAELPTAIHVSLR